MPNPKKGNDEDPCEITVSCTGNDKSEKAEAQNTDEEKGSGQKGASSKKTASKKDDSQARINKAACPDQFTPPQCDKERTIPSPNPRKQMKKNKPDEECEQPAKEEEKKNECEPNPCYKSQDEPKDEAKNEEKPPC